MGKINHLRLLWAALAATVTFIVAEVVVEGLVRLLFGIDEATLWRERVGPLREGAGVQAVNLAILLAVCLLMMWLYVILRSHFGPHRSTALVAALFLWLLVLVLWVNFVNLGAFPMENAALSLAFNLLELPAAAIAGAAVYRDRQSPAAA